MSEVNTKNGGFEFRESGGYDRAQVDSFINEVKKYIASQKNEKQLLTQKLHVLAVKIQEYQSQEAENGTLAERAESLRNEAELFEAKIEELKNAQSALEADIAAKTEEVEAKKAELSKVEASVETMKTEAFGLDAAIKAKNSALDSAAKRVAELENEEARLAIAAGEELNTKTAETRAAVAEKLAELTNSFCENVTAIKAILDNAPVVSVAVNTAPAAPAEVPAAAPVEEAPVEAEETEDEEE
ncbi:MAG: hypothetical protein IKZ19_07365, partial [Clostridia bacterium]|nr:hypothetical protein [Clostridia bacterium]